MYPDDPTANINAANAALQRKDFKTAEAYLTRAGESPEANYARGALAFMKGDYEKAEQLMRQVPSIPQSKATIEEINRIKENKIEKNNNIILK